MLDYVEKQIFQSGEAGDGALLRSVLWTVLPSMSLFLAVLRKSSDSRLWDALSINKSKNKMHKQQKALRLN